MVRSALLENCGLSRKNSKLGITSRGQNTLVEHAFLLLGISSGWKRVHKKNRKFALFLFFIGKNRFAIVLVPEDNQFSLKCVLPRGNGCQGHTFTPKGPFSPLYLLYLLRFSRYWQETEK